MNKLLTLIIIFIGVTAYAQERVKPFPVEVLGYFTNMNHTDEHSYGYSIQLWKQEDHLLGFFLAAQGVSDDTPTGFLENIRYSPDDHSLSFRARLTAGYRIDVEGKMKPSRDVFIFNGYLTGNQITGTLEHSDQLDEDRPPAVEYIELFFVEEETKLMRTMKDLREWNEWKTMIMKFRGPKW